MSSYYNYWIFGLNGLDLQLSTCCNSPEVYCVLKTISSQDTHNMLICTRLTLCSPTSLNCCQCGPLNTFITRVMCWWPLRLWLKCPESSLTIRKAMMSSPTYILAKIHLQLYLVEWAIALHGMYELALIFISISKQKNLYIVGYVQCDNRIFPAARIKILPWKINK